VLDLGKGSAASKARVGQLLEPAEERQANRFDCHLIFRQLARAHMLRQACGYALANAGHDTRRIEDWLGHRSIQHTTSYAQLSAVSFKDFWR
jgi:integrase